MAAGADIELESMKSTLQALREALERARADVQSTEQRIRAECRDELTQLQDTIQALRTALSEQHEQHEAARQLADRAAAVEIGELQALASAARDHTDQLRAAHGAELESLRREFERERTGLRETIEALRVRLEDAQGAGRP